MLVGDAAEIFERAQIVLGDAIAIGVAPKINARMIRLDIRITLFLVGPAWMGHGAIHRRPDLLGIFPEST